ncbi:hypothetical protein [Vallitalea okinawensis]|uniref:hypothetical protein n=1 Tax=Vallitalea okinawensis TaxID=2078660 RepID=UPI000CFD8D1B|nr:hypothetical protein [Vallitalea okinawensis]
MHYEDDNILVDRYLEDRLTPLEKNLFEKELTTNKKLDQNLKEMRNLFDALSNHENGIPRCNLSLDAIMKLSSKSVHENGFSMKLFGQSLIAAGIYFALFSNGLIINLFDWLNSLSQLF